MTFKRSVLGSWAFHPGTLISLSMILFVSLVCIVVLFYPPARLIVSFLYDFQIYTVVILVIFLGLILGRKGLPWEICSLTLLIVLFILPLIHRWQTAPFDGFMIGGLLPWSDANRYYEGAQRLMKGSYLTEFATRRPLFSGFFAVLLWATHSNLQFSLVLLAIMNGLAVFLATREIQKAHNAFIAATFAAICYWYYALIVAGNVITENLGLCFGCLGIAFLIQGTEKTSLGKISYGLFLLTIALSIRAGAFFILPALLLWFLLLYRKTFGWKGAAAVSVVVLIAMSSNFFSQKAIGNPNGVVFSNYSYTLYGLASGNKGWRQINKDYPGMNESEFFRLAIDKIRREPGLFIQGMMGAFKDYFTLEKGAFTFLPEIRNGNIEEHILWVLNHVFWILTWAGIAAALYRPKRALSWMILFSFLGILFSTFLLPPIDADSMRVYAATIPFTAYLAALGLGLPEILFQRVRPSFPIPISEWNTDSWLLPYSSGLLFACLFLPLIVKLTQGPLDTKTSLDCPPDEVEIVFRMGSLSSVRLLSDVDLHESYVPSVQASAFRKKASNGPPFYPFLIQELVNLEPGYSISIGEFQMVPSQNSAVTQSGYLVTKGQPLSAGDHQICVTPVTDENLKDFFFYYTIAATNKLEPPVSQNQLLFANRMRLRFYGLIVFAIILSLFDFWWLSPAKKLFVLGNMFLIVTAFSIHLHRTNIYPLSETKEVLKTEYAVPMGGYGYRLDLDVDWMDRRFPGGSTPIVYENGVPLGRPDRDPSEIKEQGKGRYSIENGELFFSASDNSNPQSNGRTYEIYGPTPLPLFYVFVSYISFFVGVFLLGRYFLPSLESVS